MTAMEAINAAAHAEARRWGLPYDTVVMIMVKGSQVVSKHSLDSIRADRLKAENGPGSESIPATLTNWSKPLPVHPAKTK